MALAVRESVCSAEDLGLIPGLERSPGGGHNSPLQYSWASLVALLSDGKQSTCNAEDLGLIPGLERSHGGGHGNPLEYSCLENSMGRGAWRATFHGVTKS